MLVTGGSGFLGRHLTHGNATKRWDLVALSSTSMDIRRRGSTIDAITDWKPSVVVHLAYRKGDRASIVDGSRNVAEAAADCNARLVHISTDVVFGGQLSPYTEQDKLSPLTEYGRDKADAERAVMHACPGAVMIRPSLLYGTDKLGHLQLDVQRALDGNRHANPMRFFTDEFRCPVHVDDVAAAIVDLARRPDVIGPIHLGGPQILSRADFARRTATWLGLDPNDLLTGTISESGLTRPARVVLDSSMANKLGITCRSVDEAYRRRA